MALVRGGLRGRVEAVLVAIVDGGEERSKNRCRGEGTERRGGGGRKQRDRQWKTVTEERESEREKEKEKRDRERRTYSTITPRTILNRLKMESHEIDRRGVVRGGS